MAAVGQILALVALACLALGDPEGAPGPLPRGLTIGVPAGFGGELRALDRLAASIGPSLSLREPLSPAVDTPGRHARRPAPRLGAAGPTPRGPMRVHGRPAVDHFVPLASEGLAEASRREADAVDRLQQQAEAARQQAATQEAEAEARRARVAALGDETSRFVQGERRKESQAVGRLQEQAREARDDSFDAIKANGESSELVAQMWAAREEADKRLVEGKESSRDKEDQFHQAEETARFTGWGVWADKDRASYRVLELDGQKQLKAWTGQQANAELNIALANLKELESTANTRVRQVEVAKKHAAESDEAGELQAELEAEQARVAAEQQKLQKTAAKAQKEQAKLAEERSSKAKQRQESMLKFDEIKNKTDAVIAEQRKAEQTSLSQMQEATSTAKFAAKKAEDTTTKIQIQADLAQAAVKRVDAKIKEKGEKKLIALQVACLSEG